MRLMPKCQHPTELCLHLGNPKGYPSAHDKIAPVKSLSESFTAALISVLLFKSPIWRITWWRDQRGITGLETAIVLIAMVVVSSVFAFVALTTGLYSNYKAGETIPSGLAQTRGSTELKGSVVRWPFIIVMFSKKILNRR